MTHDLSACIRAHLEAMREWGTTVAVVTVGGNNGRPKAVMVVADGMEATEAVLDAIRPVQEQQEGSDGS